VDAIRRKKVAIEPWLTDPHPEVQAFVSEYIRQADLQIADEPRRAEERKALRELEYDYDYDKDRTKLDGHDDDDEGDGGCPEQGRPEGE
jgi:hypothetical protein